MYRLSLILLCLSSFVLARGQATYRYWLDSGEAAIQTGTFNGNRLQLDIPTDSLSDWFHVLHVQITDSAGTVGTVISRTFAIVPEVVTNNRDLTGQPYRYWFDSDEAAMQTGTLTGNGLLTEISVSGLTDWFHVLHVQTQDDSGNWSAVVSRTFAIIPQETVANRDLTGQPYRYWFDDADSAMQTATLTSNVIELDASTMQLSYGSHDFHLQVCDDQGRWSPALSQSFVNPQLFTDTVTAFSSPSFIATLAPNGGTAQYIGSSYYRLGGGGSLTLTGKSNVDRVVKVKLNLQGPTRTGSDVSVSSGVLAGDSITSVGDSISILTITANGSWPQLWLSSLTVTYEGTEPTGAYAIRLPQYMAYGTVTSDKDWADEGDVVTLTATADADCHLTHLYANRGAVTLTPSATSADQYTFTMPAEDVTVGAVFAEGGITTGVLLNVPEDSETADKTPIYNLQGQRLIRPRPGINIIDGKKAVVR